MDATGEHDVAGSHAAGRRRDPLAHAFGVDRECGAILENACSGRLRQFGEPQRIIERMNVKRARQVQGVKVVIGLEHVPDPLGRP